MSDSFADIWASSAPSKTTVQQPQNKIASSNALPRRQQYDAFSILSASQPSREPLTNNRLDERQIRQPSPASRGEDAFSGLFTSSLDSATGRIPDRASMTMAERAVLAQKAKVAQSKASSAQIESHSPSSSPWDGLDALVRPTTTPRPPPATAKAVQLATSSRNDVEIENDDWGLPEFSSPLKPEPRSPSALSKLVPGSASSSLWDLDGLGPPEPQTSKSKPRPLPRTGTLGDFDFGDREDGLLGNDGSDVEDTFGIRVSRPEYHEDDILGDLGKPASSHPRSSSPNPPIRTTNPIHTPCASASPPPHITGQLVEIGFSPTDARAALANTMTENGFDVQAAAELLLSQAGQDAPIRPSPHPSERERGRNGDFDRDSDRATRLPTRTDSHPQPPNQTQPQLDITAEKLLSQASEIGRGMFNKANALWKEGKERAVKMYEDRAAAVNGAPALDGRPRWMRDRDHARELDQPEHTIGRNTTQTSTKDDSDEEQGMDWKESQRPSPRHSPPSQPSPQSQPSSRPPEREQEVNLFDTNSPIAAYQSPFRRGKSKMQTTLPTTLPARPISTPSTQTPPSTSRRSPQPSRIFMATIALSALTTSTSHKSAGTDAYKRGDFPAALTSYARALSALPPEHVLRVPILTNVALVRSKVGELKNTIKACEETVLIIRKFVGGTTTEGEGGMAFASETDFDEKTPVEVGTGKVKVSVQDDGGATSDVGLPTSIDLIEGLSKAFRRRAEALEGLEKWEMARNAWEVVFGAEWAGASVKGEAMKGMGRCRRMVDGSDAAGASLASQSAAARPRPRPKPQPKPTSNSATSAPPSAALTTLRSTHNAQQTEDAARLACKDTVDARLAAWKSSREGNIRTLLTSLDESVLWPELGWRKVGLSEVVSKGQVKMAYMRAVAKVHPDKLNAGNTTVEQRMIANGVFGALNDAWNVFQQQK